MAVAMKFAERVASFFKKSIGDEEKKNEVNDPEDEQENGEGEGENVEKSNLTDATDLLNALVDELKTMNKSLDALSKRQDGIEKAYEDIGEAVVGVGELVSKIANSPMPLKASMAKGGLGNGATPADGRLPLAEYEQAQKALIRACQAKRMSISESTRLDSEMQKAMQIPGYQMRPEDVSVINGELKATA